MKLTTLSIAICFMMGCMTEVQTPSESSASEQLADPALVNDAEAAGHGCSVVEWCDAPGSDGARCRQLGCSFQEAFDECIAETQRVCGTPKCPWMFKPLGGSSFDICLF